VVDQVLFSLNAKPAFGAFVLLGVDAYLVCSQLCLAVKFLGQPVLSWRAQFTREVLGLVAALVQQELSFRTKGLGTSPAEQAPFVLPVFGLDVMFQIGLLSIRLSAQRAKV